MTQTFGSSIVVRTSGTVDNPDQIEALEALRQRLDFTKALSNLTRDFGILSGAGSYWIALEGTAGKLHAMAPKSGGLGSSGSRPAPRLNVNGGPTSGLTVTRCSRHFWTL